MDALKTKEDRAYEEKKTAIADAKTIAMQAIEYGQSSLAARLMGLDPSSSTYAQDVASAMGQLRKPVETKRTEPTTKEVDGKLYQYDYETGSWNLAIGAAAPELTPERKSEALSYLQLTKNIIDSPYREQVFGLKNPLTYWTPGTNEQYVKNQVNQLKSSLSLENRDKLKGSGAVSDFESKTLERASTALAGNLNDTDSLKELNKIKGVFETASGGTAKVKITDPDTGQSAIVNADRAGIEQAIADGADVEYQ